MAIPAINVLGNPNVTEGNFQIAIEDLRKSVIGSGKAYDAANTYSQYDTCVSGGIVYYSKINSNTGNTPAVGINWGLESDLLAAVTTSGSQTISGLKTFSDGFVSISATQGIGYATGAGGTVTQLTSKGTAVTLNKPSGQITMNGAALAAGTRATFTLNNSLISSIDTLLINFGAGSYAIQSYNVWSYCWNGTAIIVLGNISAGSLSEQVVLSYELIKGANS